MEIAGRGLDPSAGPGGGHGVPGRICPVPTAIPAGKMRYFFSSSSISGRSSLINIKHRLTSSSAQESQIVLSPKMPTHCVPMPAPSAKIKIMAKYYRDFHSAFLSWLCPNATSASMPLRRLPMHMVLANG